MLGGALNSITQGNNSKHWRIKKNPSAISSVKKKKQCYKGKKNSAIKILMNL